MQWLCTESRASPAPDPSAPSAANRLGFLLERSTPVGGGQLMMSPPGERAAAPTDRADTAPGRENL